ncbi:MAG: glycogen synthase GlgA [Xanthomonadales bacterium]|jgi:starch synthase|nr:glycogen synthase GlgA [Xanthomonadales bacterium]
MSTLRILQVGAELFPLLKTGGLADVLGALPAALAARGHDPRYLLPGHPAILDGLARTRCVLELGSLFGAGRVSLLAGTLPAVGDLPAYVIDAPWLYRRPGNPYLDAAGRDWPDNLARYALLGWVGAQLTAGGLDRDWTPQLLHAHDWHAALACAWLAAHPEHPKRGRASVCTIHNLAYQGEFAWQPEALPGLPPAAFGPEGIEFYGRINCLKAGLVAADRISTVSPTYAAEITTPEFGAGLQGLLAARRGDLRGILNGIDPQVWDPATDPAIATNYGVADLRGKSHCKAMLQTEAGLEVQAQSPLLVVVSRLSRQKGLDLLLDALPAWIAAGGQLLLQGTGDPALESALRDAARRDPRRIAVWIGYDEARAHRIIAGGDLIGVPSRFEPCGLTQLYGLRYGTLPVVRAVGGLADTVIDADPAAHADRQGNGFVFHAADPAALTAALQRALALYRQAEVWASLQRQAIATCHDWESAAIGYEALYREAIEEPRAARWQPPGSHGLPLP